MTERTVNSHTMAPVKLECVMAGCGYKTQFAKANIILDNQSVKRDKSDS